LASEEYMEVATYSTCVDSWTKKQCIVLFDTSGKMCAIGGFKDFEVWRVNLAYRGLKPQPGLPDRDPTEGKALKNRSRSSSFAK
jgi:hypothetical protein